jgi:hypothetical protein
MSQVKKVKEYKNLKALPLTEGQRNVIIAKSNKLYKLRKKVHLEKKAAQVVWDNICDHGSISLANIDYIKDLLDNYKQSLEILQELKGEIYTIRNEIKQIVVTAKKNAPKPEPDKGTPEPRPNQEQKMVKFIFTVPEAISLQTHLDTFLKNRPNATKVTIELAADHMAGLDKNKG